MRIGKILIIDDELALLESLEMVLKEKGHCVVTAADATQGLDKSFSFDPDVIILDVRLPDINGLDVLKKLGESGKEKRTIIMTAFHDMETTIKAIKLGAYDYLTKPIDMGDLEKMLQKVLKRSASVQRMLPPHDVSAYNPGEIIGQSSAMKNIFKSVGKLSGNSVTVLIHGETGTGKELLARAIHFYSTRCDKPFVAINCSAIVGSLLESELFGHERGAFTNAISTKRGKFELAGSGTIFLDEVGDIPISFQPKILRFLQEKEFGRVGGEELLHSDARVIAATNRDMWKMVKEGTVREDFFYRLNVVVLRPPPLRARKSDIPLLIEHLLKKISGELGMNCNQIDANAVRLLVEYDAPGNVRELENILTRAAVMANGEVICEALISPMLQLRKKESSNAKSSLAKIEQNHIVRVLTQMNWHYGKVCDVLGISRPTLREKIKKYEIYKPA